MAPGPASKGVAKGKTDMSCFSKLSLCSSWISRDYMFADYFTKAQQGAEFRVMRDFIMGVNPFEE